MPEILRHVRTGGLYEVLFRGGRAQTHFYDFPDAAVLRDRADGNISIIPTDGLDQFEIIHPASATPSGGVPGSKPAVQAPSSTLGEVERRVDALIEAARSRGAKGMACAMQLPSACAQAAEAVVRVEATRTALLSHISTAARAEGAGDGLYAVRRVCEVQNFDLINHHNALKCPYCNPHGMVLVLPAVPKQALDDEAQPRLEAAERAYREAFDAYASPHLTALRHRVAMRAALSAADATTPTERSA